MTYPERDFGDSRGADERPRIPQGSVRGVGESEFAPAPRKRLSDLVGPRVMVLLLVLLVMGLFGVSGIGGGGEDEPRPAGTAGGGGSAASEAQTQTATPNKPTWSGPIRVTDSGIDMNVSPPSTGDAAFATIIYHPETTSLSTNNSYPSALWTSASDPTYAQCVTQIGTQPMAREERNEIPYEVGVGVCIETFGKDAIAFVRGAGEPGGQSVQMDAIRWRALRR